MSAIHGFPSEKELEAIANRIFKNVPEDLGLGEESGTAHIGNTQDFNIKDPKTSLDDPFLDESSIPQAVAGDGRTPWVSQLSNLPQQGGVFNSERVMERNDEQDNLWSSRSAGLFPATEDAPNYYPSPTSDIPFLNETYKQFEELGNIALLANPYAVDKNSWSSLTKITGNIIPSALDRPHAHVSISAVPFDVQSVRKDFPILGEYVNGRPLVWLDNAATTQKPQTVIDRLAYFYKHENSNIHRAAHELAARATDAYEEARQIVQRFLNASSSNEIIFTRGTTEAINLVAQSWGDQNLTAGDEIIISHLEHHANIVPWQQLSKKKGFKIRVIPVDDEGNLLLDEYLKLLNEKTKLVSFTQVSNALGTVTPAKAIIELAHQAGAKVLLDGAQSVSHIAVDLQDLDPDFFVLSGHKIFGPTGIGVLYGKEDILNATQPYQSGGNMIKDVTLGHTEFHDAPNRFEAGTGNIADAVGLGAALEYVQKIGLARIAEYEHELLAYATRLFQQIPGVTLIGTAREKTSVMSFTLKGYENDQIGRLLNDHGIAVRTGHHCAQPILRRLGYETSVRPSLAFYNTFEEIDLLAHIISRAASYGVNNV